MADSAVRLYAPDHPALANTVRAKIMKERVRIGLELADGLARDWQDYKHRTGMLVGLDMAIGICDQAEKDLRE